MTINNFLKISNLKLHLFSHKKPDNFDLYNNLNYKYITNFKHLQTVLNES